MKRKIHLSSRSSSGEENCPFVRIRVRTRYGDFVPVRFFIDTGADYSALPIPIARRLGFVSPQTAASQGMATGLVGSVLRYGGVLHLRLFNEDFTWPCDFLDAAGPASVDPYGVLGRAGFTRDFAFCL